MSVVDGPVVVAVVGGCKGELMFICAPILGVADSKNTLTIRY